MGQAALAGRRFLGRLRRQDFRVARRAVLGTAHAVRAPDIFRFALTEIFSVVVAFRIGHFVAHIFIRGPAALAAGGTGRKHKNVRLLLLSQVKGSRPAHWNPPKAWHSSRQSQACGAWVVSRAFMRPALVCVPPAGCWGPGRVLCGVVVVSPEAAPVWRRIREEEIYGFGFRLLAIARCTGDG